MKSIERAHDVVVPTASCDAARGLCGDGNAGACIVTFDDPAPDGSPVAASDAPVVTTLQ